MNIPAIATAAAGHPATGGAIEKVRQVAAGVRPEKAGFEPVEARARRPHAMRAPEHRSPVQRRLHSRR